MTIRNVVFRTTESGGGKCLQLEECEGAVLEGCTFSCPSPTLDMAPYPARAATAAALYCTDSTVKVSRCRLEAAGLEARGLVVEGRSRVEVEDCQFLATFSSAVWVKGREAHCRLARVAVKQCGG